MAVPPGRGPKGSTLQPRGETSISRLAQRPASFPGSSPDLCWDKKLRKRSLGARGWTESEWLVHDHVCKLFVS